MADSAVRQILGAGRDGEHIDGMVNQPTSARTRFALPLHASMLHAGTGEAYPVLNWHSMIAQLEQKSRVTGGLGFRYAT
jgi:hypothetical protein